MNTDESVYYALRLYLLQYHNVTPGGPLVVPARVQAALVSRRLRRQAQTGGVAGRRVQRNDLAELDKIVSGLKCVALQFCELADEYNWEWAWEMTDWPTLVELEPGV